jgi:hypothetical protein
VQRTVIFVDKRGKVNIEGAAHRDIKFNIAVRCTFKTREKFIIATNITRLCRSYTKTL